MLNHVGWVAAADAEHLAAPAVRQLIHDYCFDYVTVPEAGERVVDAVGHAYGMVALAEARQAQHKGFIDGEMIGTCEPMRELFRLIHKVAPTDAPVFIRRESGTGKELTAQAIHHHSPRRDAPFVAINCGAIPPDLLQSELFGHERGAFTGATQRRIGRVEAASGGTLFLDEIGDLPLDSQVSMLRFLQERTIERLGGQVSITVDVRIISATHVDLDSAMRDGRFRTDLYHRLCVLRLDEPPLRARGSDIELLARHVLARFRAETSRRIRGFSADGIAALYNYDWPGNVRELINRVRRAIVMADDRLITARDLEFHDWSTVRTMSLSEVRETAERHALEASLLRHRGRLVELARELGVSRATLYRLLCAHNLRGAESEEPLSASETASDGLDVKPGAPRKSG